ncbi:MAG: LysR substrate-binding domain-containing protein, partial [Natronospirillum sp.]
IGSLSAMASSIAPRAIQMFRINNPKIKVTLQVMSSSAIRNMVADGLLDIGLAADEIDQAGVDVQLFASSPGVIALAPDHPLASEQSLSPSDIAHYPLIGLSPEDQARRRFETAIRDAGFEPNVVVETPNSSAICALALSGDAIGLVNPLATDGFPERGLILRPFLPNVPFRSFIIFRPDIQKTRLVREYVAILYKLRNSISLLK